MDSHRRGRLQGKMDVGQASLLASPHTSGMFASLSHLFDSPLSAAILLTGQLQATPRNERRGAEHLNHPLWLIGYWLRATHGQIWRSALKSDP